MEMLCICPVQYSSPWQQVAFKYMNCGSVTKVQNLKFYLT